MMSSMISFRSVVVMVVVLAALASLAQAMPTMFSPTLSRPYPCSVVSNLLDTDTFVEPDIFLGESFCV